MSENGWFVSFWMYIEMFIAWLCRPLAVLGRRYPLALPALVLGSAGVLLAQQAVEHHLSSRLVGWMAVICIIATGWMLALMLSAGRAPELERVDSKSISPDPNNWFDKL